MAAHSAPLLETIAIGLGLAFGLGVIAHRLRASPLVGYLVAGIIVGPSTPGFVADQALARDLAEIGIILLMFGVGLHFTLRDLLAVRAIAIPGAIAQIAIATAMGMALAWELGWGTGSGLMFGLSLSVASTVVMIRALQERHIMETERGRIAVGWLVVEDLVMVLALVLIPVMASVTADGVMDPVELLRSIAITVAKVVGFAAFMIIVGRRAVPALMHYVAHTGSRELFRLAVYAVALGIAYIAATLFEVSFALGAFFAGMVLAESQLSHRAAEEAIPLRDAFAVLFFLSVGMMLHPQVLWSDPLGVLATLAIVMIGKSVIAVLVVRLFGHPWRTGMTIAASLAQIGEFSFILVGLGVANGLLSSRAGDLVLAAAILSILLNPILFALLEDGRIRIRRPRPAPATPAAAEPDPEPDTGPTVTTLTDHDVLVGYGRVGSLVGTGLRKAGRSLFVFEEHPDAFEKAQADGAEGILGNAADPRILGAANIEAARRVFVTIPEHFQAGIVVETARSLNPSVEIVARAHSEAAIQHLLKLGANLVIMGEQEIARRILAHAAPTDDALV